MWAISGGVHDTTALCTRDSELVRMSKAAFEVISRSSPTAAARILEGMAKRLAAATAVKASTISYVWPCGIALFCS